MSTPKSKFTSAELRFLAGVFIAIGLIGWWVFSTVVSDGEPVQRNPPIASSGNAVMVSPSGNAVMVSRSGGAVHFCVTHEAYDRMTDLVVAGDLLGIDQMIADGRILMTPHGTECRIIDKGILSHEVRIMSGPHRGKSGFLSRESVQ